MDFEHFKLSRLWQQMTGRAREADRVAIEALGPALRPTGTQLRHRWISTFLISKLKLAFML